MLDDLEQDMGVRTRAGGPLRCPCDALWAQAPQHTTSTGLNGLV